MDCKVFLQGWVLLGEGGNNIKGMSLKIDRRSLADSMYRSGHDRQSYQPPYRLPPHYPLPWYHLQHPQFTVFFYEEESPIYQYNDYEEGSIAYGRCRKSLILTLIGETGFLNLIVGTCFLVLSDTKEEDIQILRSCLILFLRLMGVMMLSQP